MKPGRSQNAERSGGFQKHSPIRNTMTTIRRSRKKTKFTTMSLFCGCGGEYTGKVNAIRRLMPFGDCKMYALNHNEVAVGTLSHNFVNNFGIVPLAYCEGIEESSAQLYGIRHLDMLWASPSCTHHSNARGGKPRDDQERAHMFEVMDRWLDFRKSGCIVDVYLMENVKEIRDYGPLLAEDYVEVKYVKRRSGKDKGKTAKICKRYKAGNPDPRRKGEYYNVFVEKLESLGYVVDTKILRSADYGDPTTRERFFLQAVRDGKGIHWPKQTHVDPRIPEDQLTEEQKSLPKWKSARDHVIDWSLEGKSIFYRDRYKGVKALVPNTIKRIKHGLKKFGLKNYFAYQKDKASVLAVNPDAFITVYHNGSDCARRVQGCDETLNTLDTNNRYGVVQSFISKGYAGNYNGPGESIEHPLPTITTVDHNMLANSFLIQQYGHQTHRGEGGVDIDGPMPTLATSQHHPVVEPCIVIQKGQSNSRNVDGPVPTLTGQQNIGVAEGFYIPIDNRSTDNAANSAELPLTTITTKQRHAAVEAFVLQTDYAHQTHKGVQDQNDPLATVVGSRERHALAEPFIVKANYTHSGDRRTEDIDKPLSTLTTKKEHAVAEPFFIEYYGNSNAGTLENPLPTVTTKGRQGIVESVLIGKEPVLICFEKGELSKDRKRLIELVEEREGGIENLPVVRTEGELDAHDFSRPFCIELAGNIYLVDITLRMLEVHELARAMGFPDDFEFKAILPSGKRLKKVTKKDAVRMIGNAVSVHLAEALVFAVEMPRVKDKGYRLDPKDGWQKIKKPRKTTQKTG